MFPFHACRLRPTMSRVVTMLSGDIEVATVTTRPSYLTDWRFDDVTTNVTDVDHTSTSNKGTDNINCSSKTITTDPQSPYSPPDPAKLILNEITGEVDDEFI